MTAKAAQHGEASLSRAPALASHSEHEKLANSGAATLSWVEDTEEAGDGRAEDAEGAQNGVRRGAGARPRAQG